MIIAGKQFDLEKNSYIMGILNVTPDSFSDGGAYRSVDAALRQAERMIREGASILDIGGESTRPGYEPVSAGEELERVIPVIEAIARRFDVALSLDTYKPEVAEEGLRAGVHMLNDIWGLKREEKMAEVAAAARVPICLTHNRSRVEEGAGMDRLCRELAESVSIALRAGIRQENIIVDPGIGFGKNTEQNLEAMKHLGQLKRLGYPVLLAASRKSVIGQVLDLPVDQREEGTIATTVYGYLAGARIFRVHDVGANARALRMVEAIERAQENGSDTD